MAGKEKLEFETMLNTSEAAQMLGVTTGTARRWCNEGRIKSYQINSRGDKRIKLSDAQSLLGESLVVEVVKDEPKLDKRDENGKLTNKQVRTLQLVAEGRTNKEIGRILGNSEQTVKNHISAIMFRMNARDRAHAAALASSTNS